MQSPASVRKALFDVDLEQALSLLDRQQTKLSATPVVHYPSRTLWSSSKSVDSPTTCLNKSNSIDSGLSSLSSKMSGLPDFSLSFNVQIPVKHCSDCGNQSGTYYPKYQVYKESKCIVCKDCSIFFSPSSFLKHCHDNKHGTRIVCNAARLQLATENPGIQQQKLWDEFQARLNGDDNQIRDRWKDSGELLARSTKKVVDNQLDRKQNCSYQSLNDSVHCDILASQRLLQSTQSVLQGSAEKAMRRSHSRNDIMSSVSSLTNGTLEYNGAKQPVIMATSSSSTPHLTARKSLQKYLSDDKDFRLGNLKGCEVPSDRLPDSDGDHARNDIAADQRIQTREDIHHDAFNKEDPLQVLQTAQELIHLASIKLQRQQSQSMIDWEERYQSEKKLRRKVEQKMNEIQGQLQSEQHKRRQLEVQLRALKLQL